MISIITILSIISCLGQIMRCLSYQDLQCAVVATTDMPRTEFLPSTCKTIAYPSSGGIIFEYFTGVELAWLGLSRSEETKRSVDPAKEDAFTLLDVTPERTMVA